MKGPSATRLKIAVRGAVQGVGFRPFVFRLASDLNLRGGVSNSPQGVTIEVEGARPALEAFLRRLVTEGPPRSAIHGLEATWLDPIGLLSFEIRASETAGRREALILPDIATCVECRAEVFDPGNRRYHYPFTNCTNCGPRYSIVTALPYDRCHTSMAAFTMCPACATEYQDPGNRRFHAQPNACPECGPQLTLWDAAGETLAERHEALAAAAQRLRLGGIIAVKGLGGFHLMVDAYQEDSIRELRNRKHREEKPFALMFPDLASVRMCCTVSPLEEQVLTSPEAPIVLLQRISSALPDAIAPGNPYCGVMLPSTPLHHLLLSEVGGPVIATSGNQADEPICTDEREALERLRGLADFFLIHNRPIVRHVDDSIVRIIAERPMVLRRARGYAPLPIEVRTPRQDGPRKTVLAVGAHLKNSVALATGSRVFLSQHIGDLETEQAHRAFHQVINDMQSLAAVQPGVVAADLHPDYLSTRFARSVVGTRFVGVQHHVAHVLSCLADNELEPPVLGAAWDGTGHGLDATIWGGEFFLVKANSIERVAHLRPFRLPGGDKAIREPRRAALGALFELWGGTAFMQTDLAPVRSFRPSELATQQTMLERALNCPKCSSMGRLFDVVASLTGLRQVTNFEGQAAMELEFALGDTQAPEPYPFPLLDPNDSSPNGSRHLKRAPVSPPLPLGGGNALELDWAPLLAALVQDVRQGVALSLISARFHNALVESLVSVARRFGQKGVVLSGGTFQNRYLTEHAVQRLREEGFRPYWHQRVPPNDGGIALGQVVAAWRGTE